MATNEAIAGISECFYEVFSLKRMESLSNCSPASGIVMTPSPFDKKMKQVIHTVSFHCSFCVCSLFAQEPETINYLTHFLFVYYRYQLPH